MYLNNRAAKYVKQKLVGFKGEIDKSTLIFGDFHTPSSVINRIRQKIDKDRNDLNSTITQLDLIDNFTKRKRKWNIFNILG